MNIELKKTKSSATKVKITLSISEEAIEIYRAGKSNGWDTPELAVQAVEETLRSLKEKLIKKAS